MNIIIFILKTILFLISIYSITINFFIPLYFISYKDYKPIKLKNKNISANVNHKNKKCYIHAMLTLNSIFTLIVLIYDFYNLINIKK
uniref:hypothetical protein n=1 Tax=Rice orange leaf phytoplasma TaxID=146897 RepID=UPI00155DAC83|nr:hypothetical protein [Rice orange leaf phytoplasma]